MQETDDKKQVREKVHWLAISPPGTYCLLPGTCTHNSRLMRSELLLWGVQ